MATSSSAIAADVSENVQVVVRVRPLNRAERERAEVRVIGCDTKHNEIRVRSKAHNRTFTFDRVYDTETEQAALFDSAVAPVVDEVLRGYSCTVFAYGQTGTGKTYTMEGSRRDDGAFDADAPDTGIIVRAVRRVFRALDACGGESHVKISFLELYNEKLDDLFAAEPSTFMSELPAASFRAGGAPKTSIAPGASASAAAAAAASVPGAEPLKIVEDKRSGIRVQNLEEIPVTSSEEVFAWLARGIAKRATAETACNAQSSRSHCVFTLTIHTKESTPEGEELLKVGKLNLVDLAGSECVGRSGAKDARAREAGNINQSLLTLGRVITALVDHLPHVPYRDSKLTRLLQDSLGGRTKTCIIATLSPSASCLEETMSTLEYANRAKNIKNRPEANQRMSKVTLIKEYSGEIESLKQRLAAQIAKDGVYLPESEYDDMVGKIQTLEMSLEELENLKVANEEELAGLRSQLAEVREELDQTLQRLQQTEATLVQTRDTLQQTEAALATEKEEHIDTKVVVQSRDAAAAALLTQASHTREALQQAADDAAGLHAKVARSKTVQRANETAAMAYAQSGMDALKQLQQSVGGLALDQRRALDTLITFAQAHASQQAHDAAATLSTLGKIRAAVASLTRAHTSTVSSFADEQARVSAAAAERADARTAEVVSHAQSMQNDIDSALTELENKLSIQTTQLATWTSHTAGVIDDMQRALSAFAASHDAAIAQVHGNFNDLLQRQAASAQLDAAAAQQLGRSQAELLARTAASLQQRMSQLLQEAMSECAASFRTGAAEVETSVLAHSAQVESAGAVLAQSITDARASVADWSRRSLAELTALRTATSKNYDAATSTVATLSVGVKSIRSIAADSSARVQNSSTTALAAVNQDFAAFASASTAMASKLKSQAVASLEAVSKDMDGVVADVSAAQSRTSDVVATISTTAATAQDSSTRTAQTVEQWCGERAAAAQAFFAEELRADVSTGYTPAKREYTAPSAWTVASPADAVVARYRAAKAARMDSPASHAAQPRDIADFAPVQADARPKHAVSMLQHSAPLVPSQVFSQMPVFQSAQAVLPALVLPSNSTVVPAEDTPVPAALDATASTSSETQENRVPAAASEAVLGDAVTLSSAIIASSEQQDVALPMDASELVSPSSTASSEAAMPLVPGIAGSTGAAPRQRRLLSVASNRSLPHVRIEEASAETPALSSSRATSNSRMALSTRVSKAVSAHVPSATTIATAAPAPVSVAEDTAASTRVRPSKVAAMPKVRSRSSSVREEGC